MLSLLYVQQEISTQTNSETLSERERGEGGRGEERNYLGTNPGKIEDKVEIGPLQIEMSEALTSCAFIRMDRECTFCQEQN